MNVMEIEDDKRIQTKLNKVDLEKIAQGFRAQGVQGESPTINVDAILRAAPARDQELHQIAAYFASRNGMLGNWLPK